MDTTTTTTTRAARRAASALRGWLRARRAVRAAYRGTNWSRQAASLDACDRAYAHLQRCRAEAGLTAAPWVGGIAAPVFRAA